MKFFLQLICCAIILSFSRTNLYCTVPKKFEYSEASAQAYQSIFDLRLKEATTQINHLKKIEPDNLIPIFLENYIDFFKIFINENENEFRSLSANKDVRLNKLRQGDTNSPYYRYCQAELHFQWALARLKFEENYTAFNEISKAYALLTENQKRFPEFVANNKTLGLIHAVIGTIPDKFKWGVKLVSGMSGSIAQGRNEIEAVLQYAQYNDFPFEQETVIMYAFLLLHLNNKSDAAWSVLQNNKKLNPKTSALSCFVLSNVAAHSGRNDEAIKILSQKPVGTQYHPFYFLDYQLGLYKLYRLDADADKYLSVYTQKFRGKNYIKEAYQKLGWFALINNRPASYKQNMACVTLYGTVIIEGDKNALAEAKKKETPNVTLLKARLLFDGGYFSKAYLLLKSISVQQFTNKAEQLEYLYRMGRIAHQLKYGQEAKTNYLQTIEKGEKETSYFACNAALQLGLLMEEQGDKKQAVAYYKRCLSMNPSEYADGLHQKAKAGINRLK